MRNELKKTKIILLLCLWMITSMQVIAQSVQIKGKVTDASTGEALPGVNIILKGTTFGVITSYEGTYSITVPKGGTLVFSFVGFLGEEILVADQTTIDVSLSPELTKLNEVVVIGYGTVKKADATGSLAVVGSSDFNKGVISSPQDLLVGKSAGVVVTSNSGAPGAGATIRIRGGSSLTASNDPLIVIDGIPIDNTGIAGSSNPLSVINPSDIESFTILKDASATAIYGSRASNGVILITTKRGKVGKDIEVSYSASVSMSTVPSYIDVMSGDEFRALAVDLASKGIAGVNAAALNRLGSENTNWQKEIYRNALSQDHNLSVTGTIKSISLPYRGSVGYTNQDGILKTTNMQRITAAIGLDPTLLDNHLKISLNIKYMNSKNNFGNTGAIGSAVAYDPTQPVKNGNTKFGGYTTWVNLSDTLPNGKMNPNGSPNPIGVANPVALLNQTDNTSEVNRSLGNLVIDYKFHFLPDLHANLNLGYDYYKGNGHNNSPDDAAFTYRGGIGQIDLYNQQGKTQLLDFTLTYDKDIPSINSKITAMGGYSWSHFWKSNYSYNQNGAENLSNVPITQPTENFLVSFFGRLNYILANKYLLTFTIRDDGSSRFAKGNQWGLFPSAAFAWKIKEESFLKNVDAISDLKLRLGWGSTGQQNIGQDYPSLPVYILSQPTAAYQFGSTFYDTYRPNAYDANIKWEATTTTNIGLDFGLFSNRVTGSVDLYDRLTSNLINTIPIAAGSNFSNYLTTNVGNLENKGVEVTFDFRPVVQKELYWTVGFNMGYNWNRITKLTKTDDPNYPGVDFGLIAGGVGNYIQNVRVGYPNYSFYAFQQVYDSKGMPIEGLYVDRTGQGGNVAGNNLDKYHYQKPAPDYSLGISSRLQVKNFEFSFSGRANIGNYVYNNLATSATYSTIYNQSGFFNNVPKAINSSKFINPQYFSDFYIENASFFRMDNMSLSYNLNKLFTEKLNARISFTVQNAFVITKYTGLDPEVDGGIDNNNYPRPRVYMLGLNVTF
jgi:TonB-dependent starch-binding outer membrane protein SusC